MERQGQGSGYRCGGHREQMGLQALVEQSVPLVHTEAVLLIHHHQSQAGKNHGILQQGMGPHQTREPLARSSSSWRRLVFGVAS